MQIRTAFLAALAALPLLAGGASAHGYWDRGAGYGPPGGYAYDNAYDNWREREARHAWREAERAREWAAWQRRQAWEERRFEEARRHSPGGWGPRW